MMPDVRCMQVVSFAPHMRHATSSLGLAFLKEPVETVGAVALQNAAKPLQERLPMFVPAIRRIGEAHDRSRAVAHRPVVSDLGAGVTFSRDQRQ